MSNNLIFLDIDGVLLPTQAHKTEESARLWEFCETLKDKLSSLSHSTLETYNLLIPFDKDAVQRVVDLAVTVDAKIVVISDWSMRFPPHVIIAKLCKEGIPRELFHSEPIAMKWKPKAGKCECVMFWFQRFGAEDETYFYVAIDDDLRPGKGPAVVPDSDIGFTQVDYEKALSFFRDKTVSAICMPVDKTEPMDPKYHRRRYCEKGENLDA